MREIVIGGAQRGPIQKADSREAAVQRMLTLLQQANDAGCTLVVFPELALTTFFPRHYMEDQSEINSWFEREMPNTATQPLFDAARRFGIAISFGYAELTAEGRHFNTSILTDAQANIIAKYRKVHLPGHSEYDPERYFQHLEKRYFEPGDLGFPVWRSQQAWMGMCICNDRRWPETFRTMALRGAEVFMLGYNTPTRNIHHNEPVHLREHHHRLSLESAAYQNGAWVMAAGKCGAEDGFAMIGGSSIVSPTGETVTRAVTEEDEVISYNCDLDLGAYIRRSVFNFAKHRRPEFYSPITSQIGVEIEE